MLKNLSQFILMKFEDKPKIIEFIEISVEKG